MKKPIAISFFAGAGGLDIGIHRAGFDIKLSVELEETYCKTLKYNNPNFNVFNGNIMDYNKKRIYKDAGLNETEEISLVFGGSPCQSFSTAGKRQSFSENRGKAMLKFADLISEIQPKLFILENVKGLLSASLKHRPLKERGWGFPPLSENEKKGSALKYLLSKFNNYNITYKIINAAEYGVPQKRERVFIIGIREDLNKKFTFPQKTHSKEGKNKFLTFKDVMDKFHGTEHTYVTYSVERLKYMKMIPKGGGNWRHLDNKTAKIAMGGAYNSGGGKTGYFRRIKVNEPCPTLLTSPIQKSTNIGHPFEDRPLSIEEYLEIQGFPSDYTVYGSLSEKYTQIGNAVPIKVSTILGNQLVKLLQE